MKRPKRPALSDHDQLIGMYKDMLFYRFEERVNQAYMKQKFSGFVTYTGQEGVCVGVAKALKAEDYVISGYRSHTQAIAKGIDPKSVFAELFGKADGCSGGKGGSMHMFSEKHRFLGGHGIVGGQAPLAVGVGFAIKYRQGSEVIVCYLGDAAMNQGAVFEAMNMAATWKLPVLFLVENNQYGMGTDISRTTSIQNLCQRADAFDMSNSIVDGMNVQEVYAKVTAIVEKMRLDNAPFFLEAKTFRFKGHSVSDPGKYRTKEELQRQMELDPIASLKKELEETGVASSQDFEKWDKEVKKLVHAAEEFAENSPAPADDKLWADVYADSLD